MKSLSPENQADIIEAFNSTSRYLYDLFNIDNICFEQMVNRIYPTELQLNNANSSDRYHKLGKFFSKFYRRHSELVAKYNVSLRKLLYIESYSKAVFICKCLNFCTQGPNFLPFCILVIRTLG